MAVKNSLYFKDVIDNIFMIKSKVEVTKVYL